jgi:hypothetical protein
MLQLIINKTDDRETMILSHEDKKKVFVKTEENKD